MIAAFFLLLLLGIMVAVSFFGGGGQIPLAETLTLVGILTIFFGSGVYIGAALGALGLLVGFAFSDRPFYAFIGQMVWGPSSSFVLVAVPLFLLMGEIMLRAGLSERLYKAMNVWLERLPGGLLHTNIMSSAMFSAISGSSVATAATMGSVALPFFRSTTYSPKFVLGSLAAGGALGNLIPPGITFIIYGLITETSVGQLYLAAIGPSILVVALFTLVIFVHGARHRQDTVPGPAVPLRAKIAALKDLLPTFALIGLVLGTIYGGYATPTEAAALGVLGALAFAAVEGRLSLRVLHDSAEATGRVTAMIGLILFGAYLLNFMLTTIRVPQMMAEMVGALPLPAWAIMLLIIGFYIALGTFMEGFAMIITTIPVIFPVIKALGYDPIWFGVIVTMLVEVAMISPPDGTVLYVLQGMRKDGGPITDVFSGVMPFFLVYVLAILALLVAPGLALFLPTAIGP